MTDASETKTIYVVTSGEYSDYGINAVFDDEGMAAEYIARFGSRGWRIEEYELNPFIPAKRAGHESYSVEMLRDGTTLKVELANADPGQPIIYYRRRDESTGKWDRVAYLQVDVLAKDEQHAVKIASEQRALLIALNQWPEATSSGSDDE